MLSLKGNEARPGDRHSTFQFIFLFPEYNIEGVENRLLQASFFLSLFFRKRKRTRQTLFQHILRRCTWTSPCVLNCPMSIRQTPRGSQLPITSLIPRSKVPFLSRAQMIRSFCGFTLPCDETVESLGSFGPGENVSSPCREADFSNSPFIYGKRERGGLTIFWSLFFVLCDRVSGNSSGSCGRLGVVVI